MTPIEPVGGDGIADPDFLNDFKLLYKETIHRTLGAAYRTAGGDYRAAEDATQEAYLAMFKLWLDKTKPKEDVGSYVVGIAVRKVADLYRSRRKDRCVTLEEEHVCPIDETGYAEVLDTMTILPVVRAILDHAPPRQRAVGVLYFLEGFDYPQIAETLGMSRSTARTHVQRLRKKLQPLINQITLDGQGGEQS